MSIYLTGSLKARFFIYYPQQHKACLFIFLFKPDFVEYLDWPIRIKNGNKI